MSRRFEVGTRILVSHNGKSTCCGEVADVVAVTDHGFTARCLCGWAFQGMQTDNYRITTSKRTMRFSEWLCTRLGRSTWVVAPRLTANLREKGYTLALSEKRFAELRADFEAL